MNMMSKMKFYSMAVALVTLGACAPKATDGNKVPGVDLSNLDTTVMASDDFYQYACGGWMVKNPLTPERSRFSSFDKLIDNNEERLRVMFEDMGKTQAVKGTVEQKISDLYKLGLDSVRLNEEGATPLKPYLEEIAVVSTPEQKAVILGTMHLRNTAPFFAPYVGADDKNSSMNIFCTYQAGMNMGDRDYYLLNDESTLAIRDSYKKYIARLFSLIGYDEEAASKAVETVMNIETTLAEAAFSRDELRNPQANYNKMTIDELKAAYNNLDWDTYFATLGLDSVAAVNVCQPRAMAAVNKLLGSLSDEDFRCYLTFNMADAATGMLSDDFMDASFDFYGRALSGKQEQEARWKRALNVPNGLLGEAVGEMYVAKFFSPESKERMVTLVANLQKALAEHIDSLEWMSDATKEKAQEKLAAFHVKIGYPDKWRNYDGLDVNPEESYLVNVLRACEFENRYQLADEGKPVDKDKWFMTPQTVNAYYNPTTNEICFPAGILQPPFFNADADDAVNYGAIGVVIGHEMTHGFDDQGRQYDKDGNMSDWWTEEDANRFVERANKLAAQYSSIVVIDTIHANGNFTLGENIADHGGLRVAYTAFRNSLNGVEPAPLDGFTADQRFYLAYATLWAGNITDEEIRLRTKTDPHSLGRWRVNAALRNIDSFFKAFDIKEGDPMYMAPEDRVTIW